MPSLRSSRPRATSPARHTYGGAVVQTTSFARSSSTTSSSNTGAFLAGKYDQMIQARDRQALTDLANGKLLPFIEYANERLVASEITPGDKQKWTDYLNQAHDRATEESIAAGLKAGTIDLEQALGWLQDKRDKYQPSDPEFSTLTSQIGDIHNAIQARDFNGDINQAVADLNANRDSTAAKTKFVGTLLELQTRAKDSAAQTAIQKQIDGMRAEMQKDREITRAQADNQKLIDYYRPDGDPKKISGAEIIDYLSSRAATAESAAEAQRYTSAVTQISARERTVAQAKLKAASAGSTGAASVTSALSGMKADLATATTSFANGVKVGRPQEQAFSILQESVQREMDAIDASLPNASPAAAAALLKERDRIETLLTTQQRAAAAKVVAQQKDAETGFTTTLKTLKDSGATPEDVAKIIAVRIATLHAANQKPWMNGLEADPQTGGELTKMEQTTRARLTDEAATSAGVLSGRGDTPTLNSIRKAYDQYAAAFQQAGKDPPLDMTAWFRAMNDPKLKDKDLATKLGLAADAASIKDLSAERPNVQKLWAPRNAELQQATNEHIAAAWPRDTTGTRFPFVSAPMAGEPLRDQTAANLNDPTQGGMLTDPSTQQPIAPSGAGPRPSSPAPTPFDQPPPQNEMAASNRQARSYQPPPTDPFAMADQYLAEPVNWDLPTWELPPISPEPAFSSGSNALDSGLTDLYAPPAWDITPPTPYPVNDTPPSPLGITEPQGAPPPTYGPPPEPQPGQTSGPY